MQSAYTPRRAEAEDIIVAFRAESDLLHGQRIKSKMKKNKGGSLGKILVVAIDLQLALGSSIKGGKSFGKYSSQVELASRSAHCTTGAAREGHALCAAARADNLSRSI